MKASNCTENLEVSQPL